MYYRDYASMDLRGFYRGRSGCRTSTAKAGAVVRPGMLIEFRKGLIQAHSVYDWHSGRAFVQCSIEVPEAQDEYLPRDSVPYIAGAGQAGVFVLLKGGEVVREGHYLLSAGDGTLIGQYSYRAKRHPLAYAARALEDVDLSGRNDTIIAAHVVALSHETRWRSMPQTLAPGEALV